MIRRAVQLPKQRCFVARSFSVQTSTLALSNGQTFPFHVSFLRENLGVAFDATSLQRTTNNLPTDLELLSAVSNGDCSWHLTFSDQASGTFHLPPACEVDIEALPRSIWGVNSIENVEQQLATSHAEGGIRFHWSDLAIDEECTDDTRAAEQLGAGRAILTQDAASARVSMIEAVHTYGIALLDGVPCEPDQGVRLADNLIGAVETTNFGYKFVIKSVKDPHNLAFGHQWLQHHTDFTYCRKVPDVALFHCIQNADEGGDSLWLDGFACAEALREEDEEAFQILCQTPVSHMDITDKWDLRATHPTLGVCPQTAALKSVVFNERTRDSWRQWRPTDCPTAASDAHFYKALQRFESIIEDTSFHLNTPLQPGELVLFDNSRILHSRTAFVGPRHMEGAYIDWAATHASWRALRMQAAGKPREYCGNRVGL
jgi:hypothetical protein